MQKTIKMSLKSPLMISKAIIVFLRVPEKGRVKTRLARSLSDTFVLELYKGFAGDTLDALGDAGDKILYFWPPEKGNVLEVWLGRNYSFSPQQGENIGEKMSNAFVETFRKGYTSVLLIGSDIPELTQSVVLRAYEILSTKDAVIGPAKDGGYYLIGFQKDKFSKIVFNKIDWSTRHVLNQTIKAMDLASIQYELLGELHDIDTPEDLDALAGRAQKGGKIGKRTLENLSSCWN